VPIRSVHADVVAVTARPVTREEVNDAFREEAASDRYRASSVSPTTRRSADIIGDRGLGGGRGDDQGVDEPDQGLSWYDNEWGSPAR